MVYQTHQLWKQEQNRVRSDEDDAFDMFVMSHNDWCMTNENAFESWMVDTKRKSQLTRNTKSRVE